MPFKDPEARKQYQIENKEKRAVQRIARRLADPEKYKAVYKAEYEKDPARAVARQRAFKERKRNSPEAVAARAQRAVAREAKKEVTRIKQKERVTQWRELNREKFREILRAWKKDNRGKVNADKAKYYAAKIQAIPKWADLKAIAEIYKDCQFVSYVTGDQYHVDHIVPLRSPLVCGLHCEANLRVLPGLENSLKSNLHWPDMP
jgi:hypothetical protein